MHSLGFSAEALAEAEGEEMESFFNPMPQPAECEARGEGGIINGMMAWAPAAARVRGFLSGGPVVSCLAADIAALRHPLGGHPAWRRDLAAAEDRLRATREAAEAARKRRHAENQAARAEENRRAAKPGGAGTKKGGR